MQHQKVEFRQRLDFGQLIAYFFDFIKYNWKGFTNIFLRYNGPFMLLFIGVSYLMVSGYFGLINSMNVYGPSEDYADYTSTALGGVMLYLLALLLVTAVNFGISSIYMSEYVKDEVNYGDIDGRLVWDKIKQRAGSLALFMFLLIMLFIGWLIIFVILAFIPIIGFLFGYALLFALFSWAGISCMAMLHQDISAGDALGVGWNLMMGSFWKCVGINFIVAIIIMVLRFFILSIPSIVAFWLFMHAVEERSMEITDTVFTIIWTIFIALATLVSIYAQALSQFMNGGLYFSLQEAKTNSFLRAKIDQIGAGD